jgi:hypothetical protein
MTGGVIGFIKSGRGAGFIIGIVIILIVIGLVAQNKKKPVKEEISKEKPAKEGVQKEK